MSTLVYKYGLRPPIRNADLVDEQIRLAHRYHNALIEVERTRQEQIAAAYAPYPEVAAANGEVGNSIDAMNDAEEAIGLTRQASRRRTDTATQRISVAEAKAALSKSRGKLKAAKAAARAANPALVTQFAEIGTIADHAKKSAYFDANPGLFWGQRALKDAAMEAYENALKKGRAHGPPDFRRWSGDGSVGLQIMGGLAAGSVFGADRRLQIDPVPDTAWDRRRSPEQRTAVRLRIGSEGRDPIWAEWPMILHRPLPPTAHIMWAKVVRERLAGKDRWSLHLTLRLPDEWQAKSPAPSDGIIAVDLGWRLRPNGIRAAYWLASDGQEGEILIPQRMVDALHKPGEKAIKDDSDGSGIRGTRDVNRNEICTWLANWLKGRDLPEWLRDWGKRARDDGSETRGITGLWQWKAFGRFAALALHWRENRFPGDEEAFERLEAWRVRDKHLWCYEVNLRDQAFGWRKDFYRVVASRLASRYRTLVLEDFDLRTMQRHKPVETGEVERKAPRLQQRDVAPSELRTCIVSAFAARRGKVFWIDPAYTTQRCAECGYTEAFDAAESIHHRCSNPECGVVWDQDRNAAKNLLQLHRLFCEWRGDGKNPVTTRLNDFGEIAGPYVGRHQRRKAEKEGRSQSASEVSEETGV